MATGLVYDPIYLEHQTGSHPENASRLTAVMDHLKATGMLQKITVMKPRAASVEEIALAHDRHYIESIELKARTGGGWLDADTYLSPASYRVALYAAGGVLTGVEEVMEGRLDSAFALVRPPGHHASRARAAGFCIFNNVAVAATYALAKYDLGKIAIADFDVHHGNGTQDIFYVDARILYFSTHQYPFYPGTGQVSETGAARGNIVNVPLPATSGDEAFLRAYGEVFTPAALRFRPDLIIVSAGYDAHWMDEISMTRLTVDGYARIVAAIKKVAEESCRGKMVFALEGGYNLRSLPACVKATIEVLLGEKEIADPLGAPPGIARPAGIDQLIETAKRLHSL
ncbi:MAG: histone deacetylase [Chloroflexi bacterium]|nr:histone deacetylase [Chloroflexota bacterium]